MDDASLAPRCAECGHQLVKDARSKANNWKPAWYCPTPEKHKLKETSNAR